MFRIKSKKWKRKLTCTAEHKHLKFLKFSAKKANLLSEEVAEDVSNLNFAMNADQSDLAVVNLKAWLNRIKYEPYEREFKTPPYEEIIPSMIGKLTSINLNLLHGEKIVEVAVNLLRKCRGICLPNELPSYDSRSNSSWFTCKTLVISITAYESYGWR